jgi:hypothetical protein
MVRSVLAALRFGLCLVSCLDPPPNTVQERLFREILDRHSPEKSTGKLCHHLIQSFRVSPLSVTLPLLKSTHNRTRAGPLPVAFIGLAHPGHSLLLTSFTSTPLDTCATVSHTQSNTAQDSPRTSPSNSTMSHSDTNNEAQANDAATQSPSQAVSLDAKNADSRLATLDLTFRLGRRRN